MQEENNKCNYFMAYIGFCNKEKINLTGCEKHQLYCSCGDPAIKECSAAVSLVCGRPTCGKPKYGYCHHHAGE